MEDVKFMKMMNQEVEYVNGHYVIPLPFKNEIISMPNNRNVVLWRTQWLKKKLSKNPKMLQHYTEFMNEILNNGYAKEVVTTSEES